MSGNNATARQAGSGVLWLTMAKFYFMATGFVLVIFLPKIFEKLSGDVTGEMYGRYRVVIGLVNLLNMVLIGGTIQAVSKFISERESRARSVKRQTLKIQTVVGGGLSLMLFLGADFIASHFYHKPELAFLLRLAAPIVLIYSYYAVIIGAMNGLKRFKHQAMMDMMFATAKVGLTVALVAAGFAIAGAVGGFLATAAALLGISIVVLGKQPPGESVTWKQILSFEWKTLVFAFFLNALLQVDLQLIMALAPPHLGTADSQAGIYGLALQLGQLPYVATISVAFVIFPLMSRATFSQDLNTARKYVATTNRYVFLVLAGLVVAVATEAHGIMSLPFFPAVFAQGHGIFATLSIGYLFFAGVVVNSNILTASGRPMTSVAVFVGMLVISLILNLILVPIYGGPGAAIAATSAMIAGFVACGIISKRTFGSFLPLMTIVKAMAAVAVILGYALYVEPLWSDGVAGLTSSKIMTLVLVTIRLGSKFVAYFVLLAILRELTPSEFKQVLALRRRGR